MKRLHYTVTELDVLHSKPAAHHRVNGKPSGLWYSVNREWEKWCKSEMPEWVKDSLIYEIDVDLSKLLVLRTEKAIRDFTVEYTFRDEDLAKHDLEWMRPNDRMRWSFLDWARVGKQYAGIEIAPYQWGCRYDLMWYYGWDVASGCIWDVTAIQGYRRSKLKLTSTRTSTPT